MATYRPVQSILVTFRNPDRPPVRYICSGVDVLGQFLVTVNENGDVVDFVHTDTVLFVEIMYGSHSSEQVQ